MSIGPPIPGIQLFQTLMEKIQGQGHGWSQSWKSQHRSNIQSTHIPFVPCQSGIPFVSCDFFKIGPWKSRVKVMGEITVQSHNVGLASNWLTPYCSMSIGRHIPDLELFQKLTLKIKGQGHRCGHNSKLQCGSDILLTHIPFIWCQPALPFLRYGIFKIWPWKSRVKFMGEVTVQSHNVGLTSYRLISLSFHVNWASHSWDTAFSNLTLKIQGQGQMTMMLHNYRPRQFHWTSKGINPSSGVLQSLTQVLPDLTSFWSMDIPM